MNRMPILTKTVCYSWLQLSNQTLLPSIISCDALIYPITSWVAYAIYILMFEPIYLCISSYDTLMVECYHTFNWSKLCLCVFVLIYIYKQVGRQTATWLQKQMLTIFYHGLWWSVSPVWLKLVFKTNSAEMIVWWVCQFPSMRSHFNVLCNLDLTFM